MLKCKLINTLYQDITMIAGFSTSHDF